MKTKYKRFLISLVTLTALAFFATGCATTRGFGEDIEKLGEEIQGN